MEVFKYKVWCITDSKWETVWLEDDPVVCPINSTHSIDVSKTSVIDFIEESVVKQKTQSVQTGSNFRHQDYYLSVPAVAGLYSTYLSFEYDINIIRGISYDLSELRDDIINMTIGDKDPVGALLLDTVDGDSVFTVSKTVTDNLDIGYEIYIGGQSLGEMIDFTSDDTLGVYTITTKGSISGAVVAGSLVAFTYYMVKNKRYYGTNSVFIIEGSEMHSYLPKGQRIKITIDNKDGVAKTLPIVFEYLFGKKLMY